MGHEKYCCTRCRNIFATWLQRDVAEVGEIYSGIGNADSEAHIENERKQLQKEMMRRCAALFASDANERKAPIRILDFGCGPNFRAAFELQQEYEGAELFCCDINPALPYDKDRFFLFTGEFPKEMDGSFDGISSVDVFEHLNFPIEDMKRFNRLLRMGGVMIHFTPLQWQMRFPYGHYETAFHTNFPSKKSLRILCDKTGFQFLGAKVPAPGVWYIVFRKVADSI